MSLKPKELKRILQEAQRLAKEEKMEKGEETLDEAYRRTKGGKC